MHERRRFSAISASDFATLLCGVALFMPTEYYASAGSLIFLDLAKNRHL
jgi:hypothetical protein